MTSPDLFSWLRGLPEDPVNAGLIGSLWPFALDVIEAAENELRSVGGDPTLSLAVAIHEFRKAAEKERGA